MLAGMHLAVGKVIIWFYNFATFKHFVWYLKSWLSSWHHPQRCKSNEIMCRVFYQHIEICTKMQGTSLAALRHLMMKLHELMDFRIFDNVIWLIESECWKCDKWNEFVSKIIFSTLRNELWNVWIDKKFRWSWRGIQFWFWLTSILQS